MLLGRHLGLSVSHLMSVDNLSYAFFRSLESGTKRHYFGGPRPVCFEVNGAIWLVSGWFLGSLVYGPLASHI